MDGREMFRYPIQPKYHDRKVCEKMCSVFQLRCSECTASPLLSLPAFRLVESEKWWLSIPRSWEIPKAGWRWSGGGDPVLLRSEPHWAICLLISNCQYQYFYVLQICSPFESFLWDFMLPNFGEPGLEKFLYSVPPSCFSI